MAQIRKESLPYNTTVSYYVFLSPLVSGVKER